MNDAASVARDIVVEEVFPHAPDAKKVQGKIEKLSSE